MPAASTTEANDSTVARTHTRVSSRCTGTPRVAARSSRSAAARTPRPVSVRRSTTAIVASRAGATTTATRSLALNPTPPIWAVHANGGGMRRIAGPAPQARGSHRAPKASTWARPSVATVSSNRGERAKRRMTSTSARAPTTTAAARPMPTPSSHGRPERVMSSTARVAGNAPRSPWAKLTTRLARQTRASPTAPRALVSPRMAPESHAPRGRGNATICTASTASGGTTGAQRARAAARGRCVVELTWSPRDLPRLPCASCPRLRGAQRSGAPEVTTVTPAAPGARHR